MGAIPATSNLCIQRLFFFWGGGLEEEEEEEGGSTCLENDLPAFRLSQTATRASHLTQR